MYSKALKKDSVLMSFYEAFLEVYRWQRKRRRQVVRNRVRLPIKIPEVRKPEAGKEL